MHETTCKEDLLQKLLQALDKFNLPFDKLCGVVTDGAPAMVGKHKGKLCGVVTDGAPAMVGNIKVWYHC